MAPLANSPEQPPLPRNRVATLAFIILGVIVLAAVFANYLAPHEPDRANLAQALRPWFLSQDAVPGYPLGTDALGRDLLSRVIFGARASLAAGVGVVMLSIAFGLILGLAPLASPRLDNIIMRAMDVMFAFPELLLAIAVVAAIGPGLLNAVIAITIANIPKVTRVVRGQVLSVKDLDYVVAARSLGATEARIAWRNVLPSIVPIVVVYSSLVAGRAILGVAALGFLGFGVSPPTAEWGAMLADARELMVAGAWGPVLLPGVSILLTVLAFNLLGDALRDSLDPRLRS